MSARPSRSVGKLLLIFLGLLSLAWWSIPALAEYPFNPLTDVGGDITADTTWTLVGSPYNVTSTVNILNGVN